MRKIILFGSGHLGKEALRLLGNNNVAFFVIIIRAEDLSKERK